MRNLTRKFLTIFIASIISFCSIQNSSYVFAAENTILSTGYVDVSTVSVDELNVRSEPSTSSSKIGSIKHGQSVKILDSTAKIKKVNGSDVVTDPWYKISYSNGHGYVCADYVKLLNENTPYIPYNTTAIKGIDVSYHQKDIDWKKVKDSGIKFAMIRAGTGTNEDSKFQKNIQDALNEEIKVGVYWFSTAYTINGAKEEAKKCMDVISPYKDKLSFPVFFDYEEYTINLAQNNNVNLSLSSVSNICETFLSNLKSNGYKVGIYSNKTISKFYLSDKLRSSYDFWIAQYNTNCTYWSKYTMWQYSKSGKVDGISTDVDLNYYYESNPINVSKVNNPRISNTTHNSIKLNWSKVSNSSGYQIYRSTSKNGSYKEIKTINKNSTLSYTDTNKLSSNKKYYYKIRAFKTINNKNYYGDFSSIVSSETKLATPNIKLSTPKTKTIKISWSKISGAKGYEVYRSNSKNGTYSKISITSNLSYTNSKLSKKKTYYYKVRAYKVVNNKKVYSSFSSIKSITSK